VGGIVTRDVHKSAVSGFEFGENQSSESRALLKGVSEFLSLLSTFIDGCG
jgi:hypothetical protein